MASSGAVPSDFEATSAAGAGESAVVTAPPSWLAEQFRAVAARWWLVPLTLGAVLAATLVYLNRADYLYTAELRVVAAPSSSGKAPTSPLAGLAALTGLGGVSEQVSPFRFYLDGVGSPEVAARLARDGALMRGIFPAEWDAQNRRWRQPMSLAGAVRRGVFGLLGLPRYGWTPPDANRLQVYIGEEVSVRQSVKTPLVVISYSHPDPAFAAEFLRKLHVTIDAWLRQAQARRTAGNIAYLAGKLQDATLADQRQALVAALAEQERQAMLAGADAAYAADPFDVVTVSAEPTRPRALILLGAALVIGLLLGTVIAAIAGRRSFRMP